MALLEIGVLRKTKEAADTVYWALYISRKSAVLNYGLHFVLQAQKSKQKSLGLSPEELRVEEQGYLWIIAEKIGKENAARHKAPGMYRVAKNGSGAGRQNHFRIHIEILPRYAGEAGIKFRSLVAPDIVIPQHTS